MTTLTDAEFESQYDDLMKSFYEDVYAKVYAQRIGARIKLTQNALLKFLFVHALSDSTNRSYLTEVQILKMLSHA